MPTTGSRQQQKMHSLIEGKKILNDTSSFLKEILSIAVTGTTGTTGTTTGTDLESFSANNDWCLTPASAIKSIQHRGMVDNVLEDIAGLNSTACLFARKVRSRLPSFVISRVPTDRSDLHPGRH